jgi:hypothetical protein
MRCGDVFCSREKPWRRLNSACALATGRLWTATRPGDISGQGWLASLARAARKLSGLIKTPDCEKLPILQSSNATKLIWISPSLLRDPILPFCNSKPNKVVQCCCILRLNLAIFWIISYRVSGQPWRCIATTLPWYCLNRSAINARHRPCFS